MNIESSETWRWIWLTMSVIFLMGELMTPATFFFLPFAIGAGAACIFCFLGIGVGWSWAVFLIVSTIAFASLWKLGRKLEQVDEQQEGVGATRWVGQEALVTKEIVENGMGAVRLEREVWRAESMTGAPIKKGSTVVITKLAGTRLVVVPLEEPQEEFPNYPEINGAT